MLARAMGGDRRSKLLKHGDYVAALLAKTSDLRLVDVQADLASRGVEVGYGTVQRTVKRLGLRLKKMIFATEQNRPDVALARALWQAGQAELDFTRLVFVDETGTNTAMTRSHGWVKRARSSSPKLHMVTG
jgi:hypothetical protein